MADKNIIQVKISTAAGDFDDENIDHVAQVEAGARTGIGQQVSKIDRNPAPAADGVIARVSVQPGPDSDNRCQSLLSIPYRG